MNVVQKELAKGQQSLDYIESRTEGSLALRVRIKRDTYDFQSFAVCEMLTAVGWKEVATLHYSKMRSRQANYYDKEHDVKLFEVDAEALFDLALCLGVRGY